MIDFAGVDKCVARAPRDMEAVAFRAVEREAELANIRRVMSLTSRPPVALRRSSRSISTRTFARERNHGCKAQLNKLTF
jgi:hypothetical protein